MSSEVDLWNPSAIPQPKRTELASDTQKHFQWLKSEIGDLYFEFDKLTKKNPAQPVTDLALENVNAAVADAKELLAGDRSVDRVNAFVPAGQNPVNSDVLLVLSKIRTALGRFQAAWSRAWRDAGPSATERLLDELD